MPETLPVVVALWLRLRVPEREAVPLPLRDRVLEALLERDGVAEMLNERVFETLPEPEVLLLIVGEQELELD